MELFKWYVYTSDIGTKFCIYPIKQPELFSGSMYILEGILIGINKISQVHGRGDFIGDIKQIESFKPCETITHNRRLAFTTLFEYEFYSSKN
jgi:hypothetical protein